MPQVPSPMHKDGEILPGTPAHRVKLALESSGDSVAVLAGDVMDTCRACKLPEDEIVAKLIVKATGPVGITLDLPAADVAILLDRLSGKLAATEHAAGAEAVEAPKLDKFAELRAKEGLGKQQQKHEPAKF